MYQSDSLSRLRKFGIKKVILSYDTLVGVISFFLIFIYTNGNISQATGAEILANIALVSSTLFAIVLTGFTIITSFTDRYFLYAWKEIGEFDNIVTLFQYNLTLPIIVLLFSLGLMIAYDGLGAILLISLFIYMLFSLLSLVGFISTYALQRAEFVKQLMERTEISDKGIEESGRPNLSIEQLEEVNEHLSELRETD